MNLFEIKSKDLVVFNCKLYYFCDPLEIIDSMLILLNLLNPLIMRGMNKIESLDKLELNAKTSIKGKMFIFLLIVWLISSTILSYSFSGLVLNSYFQFKSRAIIETVDDVINNEQIQISGIDFLDLLQWIKPEEHKILAERYYRKDGKRFESMNGTTFRLINDGKLIIFTSSLMIQLYQRLFPQMILYESREKFYPRSESILISKSHRYTDKLRFK